MTKSLVITYEEQDESLLMAFFNRLKIKTQTSVSDKDVSIQKKVQEAVKSGYWESLNEEERESFIFGCMLDDVDTTKTVDTDIFVKKLQNRLHKI